MHRKPEPYRCRDGRLMLALRAQWWSRSPRSETIWSRWRLTRRRSEGGPRTRSRSGIGRGCLSAVGRTAPDDRPVDATALIAALTVPAAATTESCAIVRKTPDGFLNMRYQPKMGAVIVGRLKPGEH